MPQLIPFYFTNQVKFFLFVFIVLIYVFGKYILPRQVVTYISRIYLVR